MSEASKAILATALVFGFLAYNAMLVVGTAYIVFFLGHSGWWWVLTVCLMCVGSSAKAKVK